MLDTNICSDMIRRPLGAVSGMVLAHREAICTSIIVAAEMRYGCAKKGSPGLVRKVDALLEEIGVLPFEAPADAEYGRIRYALQVSGRVIGPNDLLLAAHARCLDLVLVTGNVGEFSRVPGLKVENWLEG